MKTAQPSAPAPLSYSVIGAAAGTGISTAKLEKLIQVGDITVRYVGTKRVILATELHAYLDSLPYDRP